VDAIRTQREKQGTDGVGADDPMVPSSDESDWVVRLEQSFNIFATVILQ
jgi:ubiquinol oxidase